MTTLDLIKNDVEIIDLGIYLDIYTNKGILHLTKFSLEAMSTFRVRYKTGYRLILELNSGNRVDKTFIVEEILHDNT